MKHYTLFINRARKGTIHIMILTIVSALSFSVIAEEAYPFSRLFTTNSERKNLDLLKSTINLPQLNQDIAITPNLTEPNNNAIVKNVLHLSGFINRADGQQQLWVNNRKLIDSDQLSGSLSSGQKPKVRLKTKSKQTLIKVGQSWVPPLDKIIDVYQ